MNIDPNVWGAGMWKFLHLSALAYPEKASPICANNTINFILSLPMMLPCVICNAHAREYIERNSGNLRYIASGRDALFAFYVDFHNQVNKRNGKRLISVEEAMGIYSKYLSDEGFYRNKQ